MRPQISQGAPSSIFANPPQLPTTGLFFKIRPVAINTKDAATIKKPAINSNITKFYHFFEFNLVPSFMR